MTKTNAMRMLEKANIKYETSEYEVDENDLSGVHVANQIGIDKDRVFKTLVAKGDKNSYMVFCIPCAFELDLKKCAKVSGDKRVELIPVKDLLSITGYIRGGCSPVGMKKLFPTFIDETALLWDTITISAGVRGCQLTLNPDSLAKLIDASFCDITA